MNAVLGSLFQFKYLAMFGILFLCGLGLPIPEEVTLVFSGLLVGWDEADFILASVACVVGILAGDSLIFGLGHHYGRGFLMSRPMRFLVPPRRQIKVARFFTKHGTKAVFFARFFAGVRIGVYAYAGARRMRWSKFILLDLIGTLISGPTSIFIGKWIAETIMADREEVARRAREIIGEFGHYLVAGALLAILALVLFHFWFRRRKARAAISAAVSEKGAASTGVTTTPGASPEKEIVKR